MQASNNYMNYNRIIRCLLDKKILIGIITILCILGGFLYGSSINSEDNRAVYETTSKFIILDNSEKNVSIMDNLLASGDLILSDQVLQQVIANNELDLSLNDMKEIVYVTYDATSGVVEITTIFNAPEKTQKINQDVLYYGRKAIQDVLNPNSIYMLSEPKKARKVTVTLKGEDVIESQNLEGIKQYNISPYTPTQEDKTRGIKLAIIAGILGGFSICGLCIGLELLNYRIKYPSDVKAMMQSEILGAVGKNAASDSLRDVMMQLNNKCSNIKYGVLNCYSDIQNDTIIRSLKEYNESATIISLGYLKDGFKFMNELNSCEHIILTLGYNKVKRSMLSSFIENIKEKKISVIITDVPVDKYAIKEEYLGLLYVADKRKDEER